MVLPQAQRDGSILTRVLSPRHQMVSPPSSGMKKDLRSKTPTSLRGRVMENWPLPSSCMGRSRQSRPRMALCSSILAMISARRIAACPRLLRTNARPGRESGNVRRTSRQSPAKRTSLAPGAGIWVRGIGLGRAGVPGCMVVAAIGSCRKSPGRRLFNCNGIYVKKPGSPIAK